MYMLVRLLFSDKIMLHIRQIWGPSLSVQTQRLRIPVLDFVKTTVVQCRVQAVHVNLCETWRRVGGKKEKSSNMCGLTLWFATVL